MGSGGYFPLAFGFRTPFRSKRLFTCAIGIASTVRRLSLCFLVVALPPPIDKEIFRSVKRLRLGGGIVFPDTPGRAPESAIAGVSAGGVAFTMNLGFLRVVARFASNLGDWVRGGSAADLSADVFFPKSVTFARGFALTSTGLASATTGPATATVAGLATVGLLVERSSSGDPFVRFPPRVRRRVPPRIANSSALLANRTVTSFTPPV